MICHPDCCRSPLPRIIATRGRCASLAERPTPRPLARRRVLLHDRCKGLRPRAPCAGTYPLQPAAHYLRPSACLLRCTDYAHCYRPRRRTTIKETAMWYFTWILGIGVALGFGIINVMWLEASGKFARDPQRTGTRRRPARGHVCVTHLVFFCGHAGTGKTTLAKKLIGPLMQASATPFCLLDKDTLYGGYSAAAMAMLTGDPNDRDSPLFLATSARSRISRADRYRPRQSRTRRQRAGGRAAIARSARAASVRSRMAGYRRGRRSCGSCGSTRPKRRRDSASSRAAIRTMPTNSRIGTSIVSAASCRAATCATTC